MARLLRLVGRHVARAFDVCIYMFCGLPGGSSLAMAGTWISTASMTTARHADTATFGAELYDSMLGTWAPTSPLSTGRWLHTSTLLPDGRVLVAGGEGNNTTYNHEINSSRSCCR